MVSVTGPLSEGAITVGAGQRLAINLPKREVVLREMDGTAVSSAGSASVSPEPELGLASQVLTASVWRRRGDATGPRPSLHARSAVAWPRSWTAALVLETWIRSSKMWSGAGWSVAWLKPRARISRPWPMRLVTATGQHRQTGAVDPTQSLPGSARALDAAFLLGRLEEVRDGSGRKALSWYERYLEEAPSGAMLLRRWGEKMIVTQELMGVAAARRSPTITCGAFPPEPTPAQRGRFAEGRERDRLEASMGCGLALVATLAAPAGWGATVILVRPANPKAVTAEALVRMHGELVSAG